MTQSAYATLTRLEARGLTFGYQVGRNLFKEWSADFAPGEVVAVTGPSGQGKSTLLYLLGLMVRPQRGQILVDGEDVAHRTDRERARLRATTFGFVFQDAALDPTRTVLDNVLESCLYRRQSSRDVRAQAQHLLEKFGVALRADHKPGEISGGQAQRVALCRALLHNPRIILADEPTGNLDKESSSIVVDAFHEAARNGATVIVVTHDLALVGRCTREVVL